MLLEVLLGLLSGLVRSFWLWLLIMLVGFGALYLLVRLLTAMW